MAGHRDGRGAQRTRPGPWQAVNADRRRTGISHDTSVRVHPATACATRRYAADDGNVRCLRECAMADRRYPPNRLLAWERLQRGWSYEELAERVRAEMDRCGETDTGLTANTVRRWETGDRWPEPRFRKHTPRGRPCNRNSSASYCPRPPKTANGLPGVVSRTTSPPASTSPCSRAASASASSFDAAPTIRYWKRTTGL